MNATLIIRTAGNTTSITIKRSMSFKIVHCAASEAASVTRAWIVALSNAGYNVNVEE